MKDLKKFLKENLKETKELKEMLSNNEKLLNSDRKDARVSKNFGEDGRNTETKKSGMKLEINEAEKRVFEIQTQRLLNKVYKFKRILLKSLDR